MKALLKMCNTPRFAMVNGLEVKIACRSCAICRADRVKDWVGRAIAENEVSTRALFATLTYGDDCHIGAVPNEFAATSVVKRHIQLYVKRLRKDGYAVRYLAVAEYGSLKGRSHWHILLFFKGKSLDVPLGERIFGGDKYWPHGIVQYDDFTVKSAYYCCKYMLKAQRVDNKLLRYEVANQHDITKQGWLTLSRKPPLGAGYFVKRAEMHVDQGLAPQSLRYSFPELMNKKTGKNREFYLKRGSAAADLFLKAFVERWQAKYGTNPPYSEIVAEYLDRIARPVGDTKLHPVRMVARPRVLPEGGRDLEFIEAINSFVCDVDGPEGRQRYYYCFDAEGYRGWNTKIISERQALSLREQARLAREAAARSGSDGAAVQPRGKFRISGLPEWDHKPLRLVDGE